MAAIRSHTRSFRRVLAALLVLVLAMAPFEARFMMAAHAGTYRAGAMADGRAHDNAQHAMIHHDHATHHHAPAHDLEALESNEGGTGFPTPVHHHHSGSSDSSDSACCGTFCHSACIEVAVLDIPLLSLVPRFEIAIVAPLTALAPGQLQRPPSRLLSI